jgi:hypothetical protein
MSIGLSGLHNNGRVNVVEQGRLNPVMVFTRSTTATYLGSSGLATAAVNTPRFAYDGSGNYLGLMNEAASTNLWTYSDSTVSNLTASSGVTDATTAIDTFFAKSIQFPTSTANAYKTIAQTTGFVYVLSAYIKMDDSSVPVPSSSSSSGDFSLIMQGAIATGAPVVISRGNGLYRVFALTTSTSTASVTFGLQKYSGQSAKGFRFTGVQLEKSSIMSSYIPTTSATVTRTSESILLTDLTKIKFNATQGLLVANVTLGYWVSNQQAIFTFYSADSASRMQMRRESATSMSTGLIFNASVNQGSSPQSTVSDGLNLRVAFTYKSANFGGSILAQSPTITATGTMPSNFTKLYIGDAGGGNAFYGYIKSLTYYPARNQTNELSRFSV